MDDTPQALALGRQPSKFPFRLHDVLCRTEQLGFGHIISWDPAGAKFHIYDIEEFVSTVLPCFSKQTHFSSFTRQLNAYGFERVIKLKMPTKMLVYVHKDFRRDDRNACARIVRHYAAGRKKGCELDCQDNKLFPDCADGRENNLVTIQSDKFASDTQPSRRKRPFEVDSTGDNILDEIAEATFDSSLSECGTLDLLIWNPSAESLTVLESTAYFNSGDKKDSELDCEDNRLFPCV